MPKWSANGTEEVGSFKAQAGAMVDPEKDLTDETKAKWLKRRAKEDKAHKAGIKVIEEWYECVGNKKLLKKLKKNNGSEYSLYIGNFKKQPEILAIAQATGLKILNLPKGTKG